MRLILHIGMPKAGSTALQMAFATSRRALREAGILYPKDPLKRRLYAKGAAKRGFGAFNHAFLIAGMVGPEHLGRVLVQYYAGRTEAVRSDFAIFWRSIVEAIGRHRPSLVVMSGEQLFDALGRAGPEPLRALLAPLGVETEIVCYVRRPSDHYLSAVQQQLKASWAIRPARPVTYRRQLTAAAAAAERLHVIPYDRSQFPNGDIVADFATRFVPEMRDRLVAASKPNRNASMSAEAMDIIQGYRRDRHPDANDRFTSDTDRLKRRLVRGEKRLGGPERPRLLPHVRELIDQSSVDVLWLRDSFGIDFDGIDYAAVAARPPLAAQSVADICIIDPDRRAALADAIATADGGERRKKKRKTRSGRERR